MKERFNDFLKVAKLLNKKGITPVLYGSLGLSQIIKTDWLIDDIDMLIDEVWLTEKWQEFKDFLEKNGFRPEDEHEHEFSHPEIERLIAFGSIEDSNQHSGLVIDKARVYEERGAKYYTLTAHQYLKAYEACLSDNYRQERKEDADIIKINKIKKYLRKRKE